jgi:hypothetical protein
VASWTASGPAIAIGHLKHGLGDSDWSRSLVYNYPEPTERSLEWLAVHTLHEVQHHLRDIRGQLA